MKKIAALLLTLILCTSMLFGCSSERTKGAPDGMRAVESSDKLDYYLYIPAAWKQDLSTGAVSAYCSSADLSNITMSQFTLSEKNNLEDQVNIYIEGLKGTFVDFALDEASPENVTLGGVAASKIVYTGSLAGNLNKFMNVICVVNNNLYIFTYTSTSDLYDSHLEEVQKILDNFAFKK